LLRVIRACNPGSYETIGGWIIDHIERRPCSMIRMPDGIEGDQQFFQRHSGKSQSARIGAA
jgi:bifunctional non-homologous end joining protein LigD